MDDGTDSPEATPPPMPSPPPEEVRGVPIGSGPPASVPAGSARTGALLMLVGGIAAILGAFLPRLSVSGPAGTQTVGGFSSVGFGLVILSGFAIAKGVQGLDPSRIRMRLSAPILTGLLMLVPLGFHWNDLNNVVQILNTYPGVTASIGIGFWVEVVGVVAVLGGGAILQFGDRV
jgi:hypothetical protein